MALEDPAGGPTDPTPTHHPLLFLDDAAVTRPTGQPLYFDL